MDERLERALEFSNYRITIENQRANLKRRYETMMVVHYANASFRADSDTIAFVGALIQAKTKSAVILDQKGNPTEIEDLKEFQKELIEAYHKATNEYLSEHRKLARARNIKKAMNWT